MEQNRREIKWLIEQMKLLIITHKEIWFDLNSPTNYSTIGGFPFQIQAITALFNETKLISLIRNTDLPNGATPLTGKNLIINSLPEPKGVGIIRKLSFIIWLPKHFKKLWIEIRNADVIHALVPGDLGLIGIIMSLAQKKKMFIRHCGTWGVSRTIFDKFTFFLLEIIASDSYVVLATGGGADLPSRKNKNIHWIFSTTLSESEFKKIPKSKNWQKGTTLVLASVARLSLEKNIQSIIRAASLLVQKGYDIKLNVIGDGPYKKYLEDLTNELNLTSNIKFFGNVNHNKVLELLASSNLFVFPSNVQEGFPKALVEAMACGLPIIASNVSIIPELIHDCGFVLENTKPEAIMEKIELLISNPKKMKVFGDSAAIKAQTFTIENWANEIRKRISSYKN